MCAPYEGDRTRRRTLGSCSPYPLNFAEFGYLSKSVPEGLRSLFMAFEQSAVRLVTTTHVVGTLPAGRWVVVVSYIVCILYVGGEL